MISTRGSFSKSLAKSQSWETATTTLLDVSPFYQTQFHGTRRGQDAALSPRSFPSPRNLVFLSQRGKVFNQ